jgi:hypothetical protein
LTKRLEVFFQKRLAAGTGFPPGIPAVVKAYSPPIDPDTLPKGGGVPPKGKQMLDAAIIKIEMTDLPTVALAARDTHVHLGENLYIIGFPGAVMWHDFLSSETRGAASVTFGRISGFKLDINERWVIQTDASISWGNSGGPAFNRNGEVVGAATFITTSLEGDQAIQGFNFLIPVDSVREFARQISLVPEPDSPFVREWSQGVKAYFAGEYRRSVAHTDAAIRIMAGFPDIDRLRADAQTQVDKNPRFVQLAKRFGLGLGVVAGIALLAVGIRTMRTRRSPPPAPRRRRPFRRGFVRRPRILRKDHPKPRLPR